MERIKTLIGNFHGMCMFHFSRTFHRDEYKPKDLELQCSSKSKWYAHFPFGNSVWVFCTTFQEILFSPEIFRLGRPNKPFHSRFIRNFRIFWLNGEQPVILRWKCHFREYTVVSLQFSTATLLSVVVISITN